MVRKNHIVIEHDELHPDLKDSVFHIKEKRGHRLNKAVFLSAFGYGLGSTPGYNETELKYFVAGVYALLGYKTGMHVIEDNKGLESALKKVPSFDVAGRFPVDKLRESHPFAFVGQNGSLHLVPATSFQKALGEAQRTFLRHVIPGRYRVRT